MQVVGIGTTAGHPATISTMPQAAIQPIEHLTILRNDLALAIAILPTHRNAYKSIDCIANEHSNGEHVRNARRRMRSNRCAKLPK